MRAGAAGGRPVVMLGPAEGAVAQTQLRMSGVAQVLEAAPGGHRADTRAARDLGRGQVAAGVRQHLPYTVERRLGQALGQPGCSSSARPTLWALIASPSIGNVMLLALNLPLVRVRVKLRSIPQPLRYSAILAFATLGVHSFANSLVDVLIMDAIGFAGLFMRRYDIPVGPLLLGVIFGPLMEAQFRRALSISQGNLSAFVRRPFSLAFCMAALLALALPGLLKIVTRLPGA